MRKALLFMVTAAACLSAGTGSNYVVALQDNVGIFKNHPRKLYESPVLIIDKTEQVRVIAENDKMYKVRTANGQEGWLEKNAVKKVSSKSISFADAFVDGYVETPNSVIIFDTDEPEPEMLHLKRSFKEHLSENIDHETASRLTEE